MVAQHAVPGALELAVRVDTLEIGPQQRIAGRLDSLVVEQVTARDDKFRTEFIRVDAHPFADETLVVGAVAARVGEHQNVEFTVVGPFGGFLFGLCRCTGRKDHGQQRDADDADDADFVHVIYISKRFFRRIAAANIGNNRAGGTPRAKLNGNVTVLHRDCCAKIKMP